MLGSKARRRDYARGRTASRLLIYSMQIWCVLGWGCIVAGMQADIVVVTVIPAELAEARSVFRVGEPLKDANGTVYYQGAIESKRAKRFYSIVVICIGEPGNSAAAVAATEAIRMFEPKALFLSGIGGGIRKKTKIGDAVFSERVVAYEPAAVAGGKRRPRLEPRPDTERPSYSMTQDLVSWLSDKDRTSRMHARFAELGKKPRAKKGQAAIYRENVSTPVSTRAETIASGEKLIRNESKLFQLQQLHGKIKVVEMEAAGLIEACRRAGKPWLVVRGISDFGDELKDDRFHPYASLTAAIALADFIAEGLQLEPSAPQVDAEAYLDTLRVKLEHDVATAIPRTALTPSGNVVHVATPGGFVPDVTDVYFISGPSGRGKTTALRLIAAAAIVTDPVRYPVFVRVDDRSSFPELLRGAMQLSSTVDDATIHAWFERTPTVIIADDWHRASQAARESFEAIIGAMSRSRCAVLVAGTESVMPPRGHDVRYLRLPRLTPVERDRLVDAALPQLPQPSGWVKANLPPGLYELLCEPVLLAKFLEMIRRTEFGGTRLPHDLPDLFDRLLVALLSSVHADAFRRAGEVTAICGRLVREGGPITISRIAAALAACGVRYDAGLFADELRVATLWERDGMIYVFEHEIWRTYFLATAMQAEEVWSEPGSLAAWVGETQRSELEQLLPFATGFIKNPVLQRTLFDALMRHDLELYCRSLRTRGAIKALQSMSEEERSRYVLTELHAGYIGLVDRYVPALRAWLDPWSHGDGDEQIRGEQPVIVGRLSDYNLQYLLGFGPADGPAVIVEDPDWNSRDTAPHYAPREGYSISFMRTGDDLRNDSARFVGASRLIEQLAELSEKGDLPPIGWIGRERLRTLTHRLGSNGHFGKRYRQRSVTWIRDWAGRILEMAGHAGVIINSASSWIPEIDAADLHEIVEIGDCLVANGLGEISVWNLGLPGPDLTTRGSWFSDSYSAARKRERLKALYQAVTDTYRAIYEQYFVGLDRFAFYAQFPARACVRILSDRPDTETSLDLWWEVVADWADTVPEVTEGHRLVPRGFMEMANRMRADCDRLHRPFIGFTARHGGSEWAPWVPAVTNEVRHMLSDDLRRIAGWLANVN